MSKISWITEFKKITQDWSENIEKRSVICENCEKRDGGRCSVCGCFLCVKIKIPNAQCPLKKW